MDYFHGILFCWEETAARAGESVCTASLLTPGPGIRDPSSNSRGGFQVPASSRTAGALRLPVSQVLMQKKYNGASWHAASTAGTNARCRSHASTAGVHSARSAGCHLPTRALVLPRGRINQLRVSGYRTGGEGRPLQSPAGTAQTYCGKRRGGHVGGFPGWP